MTKREWGMLLLCGDFGNSQVRPLRLAQYLQLHRLVQEHKELFKDGQQQITLQAMQKLGCSPATARQICQLLDRESRCRQQLLQAEKQQIYPLLWAGAHYPQNWMARLGQYCPPVLFCSGNVQLLDRPAVALVGSRELKEPGYSFAGRVGRLAAKEGFVLVSGNASGADRTAQDACLEAGGSVVSVIADELERHTASADGPILYCSETGYCLPFSAARAYSRNRLIHSLGAVTFVAQAICNKGGSWKGTQENLRHGWSQVYLCQDQSPAVQQLKQLGAVPLTLENFTQIGLLLQQQTSFLPI